MWDKKNNRSTKPAQEYYSVVNTLRSENKITEIIAPANQKLRLINVIIVSLIEKFNSGIIGGITLHNHKKKEFNNIPTGTIPIEDSNDDWVESAIQINAAAGTIVVGTVPKIPPITPPYFSIATVAKIATKPAKNADKNIFIVAI